MLGELKMLVNIFYDLAIVLATTAILALGGILIGMAMLVKGRK